MKKTLFLTVCAFCGALSCSFAQKEQVMQIFSDLDIPQKRIETDADARAFLKDVAETLASDTEGLLLLVDKKHFLSENYAPEDLVKLVTNVNYTVNRKDLSLRKAAENALSSMGSAAKKAGITLVASSSYRSYAYQKTVYERNVKQLGKAAADRESAMPGASQHQLGTVIDFGSITDDFAQTAAGKWLAAHGGEYGFSLSFPQGYEDVTGYRWECWHFRYVGTTAIALQNKWFGGIQQYMLEFLQEWQRRNP